MYGPDPGMNCETIPLGDEEVTSIQVYRDASDVDGMVWTGAKGSQWSFRADATSQLAPAL